MRRTIDAREHDLIAEPGDAHHGIAVERAIPGEAVDFGPPLRQSGTSPSPSDRTMQWARQHGTASITSPKIRSGEVTA